MTRLEFVQSTLSLLKSNSEWTVDSAMRQWWTDYRTHSGLRLSRVGCNTAQQAGQPSWYFPISSNAPFLPRTLLVLNSQLTCPYWLEIGKSSGIELFGAPESTMFSLYKDINQFVRALGR
jgi:hypothetical protein